MSSAILSPPTKRHKSEEGQKCILCHQECDEDKSKFNLEAWEKLKETAFSWKGMDTFGNVHEEVDWEAVPAGIAFHKLCKTSMQNTRKLQQTKKRFEKVTALPIPYASTEVTTEAKRLTRVSGPLHEKHKCVWCKGTGKEKLSIIQSLRAWNSFKIMLLILKIRT